MSDVTIAAWLNVPILIPMSIMPGTEAGRDRSVGVYYYYYKCHGLECCHHIVVGALYKNLDLKVFKLLHSSMQTSADHRSRRRHVSRMTDEKGEICFQNVKSEEQARVSSGRLFHARAAAAGKAWSPRVA